MKRYTPNVKLSELWKRMTPDLRKQFTKIMRTTPGNVRQYAEGRRGISAEVAARIERASTTLAITKPIDRTELNKTCAGCPYAEVARKCIKKGVA
jgi:DNA-binding transcriptional regulator YdaS (Cro superfamily)